MNSCVPPVETNSTPAAESVFTMGARSFLLNTDISALLIFLNCIEREGFRLLRGSKSRLMILKNQGLKGQILSSSNLHFFISGYRDVASCIHFHTGPANPDPTKLFLQMEIGNALPNHDGTR